MNYWSPWGPCIMRMLWTASGELTYGSGYTSVLTASGLCTSGTADAILSVSNILRTRYVKQVTVVAIDILKQEAYLKYLETRESAPEGHNDPVIGSEEQEVVIEDNSRQSDTGNFYP